MHIFEGLPSQLDSSPVMQLKRSTFQELSFRTGLWFALGVGFAIPISTSLTSAFSVGVLICWFLSGQYRVTFELLRTYRVATVSLILFCTLAVGLLYTPQTLSLATRNLFKYRQFLMIPIYLSFFLDSRVRLRGIRMFELALLLTLAVSMFCWMFGIEWDVPSHDHAIFKNRITQNILMSFLVYLSAWRFLEKPRKNWFWGAVLLIATVNVLLIVPGRSGYLAVGVLIGVLMYQKLGYKGILPAGACVLVIGMICYQSSDRFQRRIDLVISEIRNYHQTQDHASGVNLRIEFLLNGLELAQSSPIFGSGTGSFAMRYDQLMEQKGQMVTANPHNEYVMLLVQNGAVGVGLFLLLFWFCWGSTRGLSGLEPAFAQAVVGVYMIVCLVNSLMLDTTEGGLFGYLMGLTCAAGVSRRGASLGTPPVETDADAPDSQAETLQNAA